MPDTRVDPMVAARTVARIRRRILPFLFVLYMFAYLDRANVAFAKIPMQADLGFSEQVFGLGVGIFFIGYFLFEIPGALIVERWSARRWLARILITWGFCTVLIGFIWTPAQFYGARFLLGAAEAGFYPGVIVYLSHWFPRRVRARALAGFTAAIPVSLILGAPISALLLKLDWWGLPGWRWVFILQGIPSVALGIVTLRYLTDRPFQATWLKPEEREWLVAELEAEKKAKQAYGDLTIWQALRQRNVLLLAAALCSANVLGSTFQVWLPSIIRMKSDISITAATALAALPFIVALAAGLLSGRSSDRTGERRFHCVVPLLAGAVFFPLSAIPGQPFPLVMAWLALTAATTAAWPPAFWVLPTSTLGASAAAASTGLINSIGNLGGFIGPSITGFLLSRQYSMRTVIAIISVCYIIAAGLIFALRLPHGTFDKTLTTGKTGAPSNG